MFAASSLAIVFTEAHLDQTRGAARGYFSEAAGAATAGGGPPGPAPRAAWQLPSFAHHRPSAAPAPLLSGLSVRGPPSRIAKCRATLSRPPGVTPAPRRFQGRQDPAAARCNQQPRPPPQRRALSPPSRCGCSFCFPFLSVCRKSPREWFCRSNLDRLMVNSLGCSPQERRRAPESVASVLI